MSIEVLILLGLSFKSTLNQQLIEYTTNAIEKRLFSTIGC